MIIRIDYILIMESTTMIDHANCNHIHGCVKKEKAPLDDLFGAITGATIWNIIRMGLFPDAWWAILISVILGFGVFGNVIHAIAHIKEIFRYEYKTKPQDIVGNIIGLIVVNIIFGILFMGQWWAQIPIAAVGIGLVKVVVEAIINFTHGSQPSTPAQPAYANTPAQPAYEPVIYQPAPAQPLMGQPAVLRPVAQQQAIVNCPNCGFEKAEGIKFCPACGYKF